MDFSYFDDPYASTEPETPEYEDTPEEETDDPLEDDQEDDEIESDDSSNIGGMIMKPIMSAVIGGATKAIMGGLMNKLKPQRRTKRQPKRKKSMSPVEMLLSKINLLSSQIAGVSQTSPPNSPKKRRRFGFFKRGSKDKMDGQQIDMAQRRWEAAERQRKLVASLNTTMACMMAVQAFKRKSLCN